MRKDILIHLDSGDLKLSNGFRSIATCTVRDNGTNVVLTLEIENDWRWAQYINTGRIAVNIPYIPIDKPVLIRIARKEGDSTVSITTVLPLLQSNGDPINACALSGIDIENYIITASEDGKAYIVFPGNSYDFTIGNSNAQNKACLLECNPGNSYRYPTVGVGLINWLGATSNLVGLGQKLMEEFSADGTPVLNARYLPETQTMYLELDTKNVDSNEDI